MKTIKTTRFPQYSEERGVVLVVTLFVLVVMTFAAVATIRQLSALSSTLADYSFRATGDASTLRPIETIISELAVKSNSEETSEREWLNQNHGGEKGYYATRVSPATEKNGVPELLQLSPDSSKVRTFSPDATGNIAYAVVERLCSSLGEPTGDTCAGVTSAGGSGNDKASYSNTTNKARAPMNPEDSVSQSRLQVTYRITVRVEGPKKAASLAQAIVNI